MPEQTKPAMLPPFGRFSAVARLIELMMMPKTANGMFNQFKAPRQGMKPISIITAAKIPMTKLSTCMFFFSC